MRILISIPRFEPGRTLGSEVFLSSFLKSFSKIINTEKVAVVGSSAACSWGNRLANNFEWMPQDLPDSTVKRMIYERVKIEGMARKWNADVIYFPFNIMPRVKIPSVLLLHDLVNEFYCKKFPFYKPFYYRLVRYLVRESIKNADSIITTSQTMTDELMALNLTEKTKKVYIVPLAVDRTVNIKKKPETLALDDKKIILQSGAQLPHKSHITGVKAMIEIFKKNRKVFEQIKLVLTGGINKDKQLMSLIKSHNLETKVIFLGKINDEEMEWVMSQASIACFPTIYEGFGLGIVDAQLRGTSIIASDIPVLKEVSGGAAKFFEPENAEDLAEKIIETIEREANELIEVKKVAEENVNKWDWESHSRKILDILINTACA